MALDFKYGEIDIPGIPEDEPVFVIRAKDKLAVSVIDFYRLRATHAYALEPEFNREFIDNLTQVVSAFNKWAEDNAEKMKVPD